MHDDALASERRAVAALDRLTNDPAGSDIDELRAQYSEAAESARAARGRIRDALASASGSAWMGGDEIAEATALNDDLLRCHETLDTRAQDAFRFVESGRARRGSVKQVWGLIDPRTCFDELAPAWDALLR